MQSFIRMCIWWRHYCEGVIICAPPHLNCAAMLLQHLQCSNTFQFICIQDSLKHILTAELWKKTIFHQRTSATRNRCHWVWFLICISQESRKNKLFPLSVVMETWCLSVVCQWCGLWVIVKTNMWTQTSWKCVCVCVCCWIALTWWYIDLCHSLGTWSALFMPTEEAYKRH